MNAKNRPAPQPNTASKLDGSVVVRFLLGYEDYWKLMVLLFAAGLLAGTAVYVFARATYSSNASIRVNAFLNPTLAANGQARADTGYVMRQSLMQTLTSNYMVLEAGKIMGFANDKTTYLEIKDYVLPKVRVTFLDEFLMHVAVETFEPRAAREFPRALIEAYENARKKARSEFREKAIQRYVDELAEVRKRLEEQLDSRLQFEEESALANAQLELERLSDVPIQQVRLRYQLQEMERLAAVLAGQGDSLGTVGKLALLGSLQIPSNDRLATGRLVRAPGGTPVKFEAPGTQESFTQVVVQPDMVEGLKPWQELEKRKRTLEEKARQTREKFLEDHPEMRALRSEIAEVSAALELELEVAQKAFELEFAKVKEDLAALEKKLPAYYEATKNYDAKRLGYDLMQKGQLAWDKAYEQLAKQIESLTTEEDSGAIRLQFEGFVDLRDEIPVSPSKSKLAMLGALMGLGLAFGIPFLLRRFDSSITDLNEFEHSLGIPGIGLVPMTDPKVLEEINRSPAVGATIPNALLENFRLIRSSILLNPGPRGEAKVVMVTSARPSEGKTTAACNIGWAFASMGERTLVIDCDLRRGRVHGVMDIPNKPGLTDLLSGKASLEDCLNKSPADNLWAIPRGPVVAGTTELLNTEVFEGLLKRLRGEFDRIILDTPPVLGLSETAFLQDKAEGVVLVVKCGATPRKDVMEAFSNLRKLGAHFYGFVLNKVDFTKRANMYYYYYYSSNYYDLHWESEDEQAMAQPQRVR